MRLVPFIIVCKLNGKEGDKLAGQHTAKTEDVKSLCRICCCPTLQSHDAYRDDPLKTETMIRELVKGNKKEELKAISQQHVWNAFYEVTMGKHNDCGIHGATPPDLTHYLDIGQQGYARDCLFAQLGDSSKLGESISSLGSAIGVLLQRRSDRNLPRTSFNRGVKQGKVMAHEMTGVILVLTGALRCSKGRNLILNQARGDQKKYFPDERAIRRWIMYLETILQLGAWLNQPQHEVRLVERSKIKLREYMNMCKLVGQRQEGMKYNTLNHHITKHVPQSILDFGSSSNVDTDFYEMHHKDDKKTAQRTQKHQDKFDTQMGVKVQERKAVDCAMEEIIEGRKKWLYYVEERHVHSDTKPWFEPQYSGVKVTFWMEEFDLKWKVRSKMKGKDSYVYDVSTQAAMEEILDAVSEYLDEVQVYDTLTTWSQTSSDNKQQYRASPHFEGKPWQDWGIFDMSTEDSTNFRNFVPCHIKALVDLSDLPKEAEPDIGLAPGLYLVVEPTIANPDRDEQYRSELWEPWLKTPSTKEAFRTCFNNAQLVRLDQLKGPATLIPDLGDDDSRAHLRLVPKASWSRMFEQWLNEGHTREFDPPKQGSAMSVS